MSVTLRPSRWEPLRPHPKQSKAFFSKARFVNLACGRGSGKTELARRKIVLSLAVRKPWKNPLYFYALPTYNQAKRIAWRELLELIPHSWLATPPNLSDLRIQTIFGSELYVLGMDKPQRIEGLQYDGGVVDEACDQRVGSWDLSIMPALTHRNGWCWRIGVPKRNGICSREYKEYFDYGLSGENPDVESYHWPSSDILLPEQLASFKQSMDVKDYREQFEASWEQAGGLIFHAFDEKVHTKQDELCHYRPDLPLYIGMDFNVDPMSWVIGHILPESCERDRTLVIFDEIFIRNTHTQECLDELYRRYQHHKKEIYFCGDAASRQRKSNAPASFSDYMQVINFKKWDRKHVQIPRSNPAIADRFATTNAALMNADGEVHVYIHSRCKRLILDLSYRAYKENSSIPNDGADEGHITDALGYLLWMEFPMVLNKTVAPVVLSRNFG